MNAMLNDSCPLKSEDSIEVLLDYTARKLDPARTAILEQHMAVCADCALFRDEQSAVWEAMDAWTPAPVSPDFNRRLWQRIDEERAAPWYSKAGLRNLAAQMRASAWKPVFPLAAGVLVVCAGFLLDHPGTRPMPAVNESSISDNSRVTISEADQLQRTLDDIQLLNQFDSDSEPSTRRM